MMAEDTEAMGR